MSEAQKGRIVSQETKDKLRLAWEIRKQSKRVKKTMTIVLKQEKNLFRDGLWDEKYNCPYYWNSDGEMNKYLGIDVPDECIVYCDENEEFNYDNWLFRNTNYVLKEQQEYSNLSQHIGRYI